MITKQQKKFLKTIENEKSRQEQKRRFEIQNSYDENPQRLYLSLEDYKQYEESKQRMPLEKEQKIIVEDPRFLAIEINKFNSIAEQHPKNGILFGTRKKYFDSISIDELNKKLPGIFRKPKFEGTIVWEDEKTSEEKIKPSNSPFPNLEIKNRIELNEDYLNSLLESVDLVLIKELKEFCLNHNKYELATKFREKENKIVSSK